MGDSESSICSSIKNVFVQESQELELQIGKELNVTVPDIKLTQSEATLPEYNEKKAPSFTNETKKTNEIKEINDTNKTKNIEITKKMDEEQNKRTDYVVLHPFFCFWLYFLRLLR